MEHNNIRTNNLGLNNLASNLIIKRMQLGTSLKELATLSKTTYSILLKIVKQEPVMPTLSTLQKLAEFFKVDVADLLKSGNLPQYIPKFSDSEYHNIEIFLKGNNEIIRSEYIDSFISDKAFAIDYDVVLFNKIEKVTFYFSPFNNLIFNKWYLIKEISAFNLPKYHFVEIINEVNGEFIAKSITDQFNINNYNFKINSIEILGVAVKRKFFNDNI